jgi:hypothetical protein
MIEVSHADHSKSQGIQGEEQAYRKEKHAIKDG